MIQVLFRRLLTQKAYEVSFSFLQVLGQVVLFPSLRTFTEALCLWNSFVWQRWVIADERMRHDLPAALVLEWLKKILERFVHINEVCLQTGEGGH